MTRTIEDIVLDHDRRGIGALRPHVPGDFCAQAARYILGHPGPVVITTGFYILMSDAPETDGPPGAFAIGNAVRDLGHPVIYVADRPVAGMMASWLGHAGDSSRVVDFPISDDAPSNDASAAAIVDEFGPALMVSIERCSPDAAGIYRNMRSRDISPQTARVDRLFGLGLPSIGIGDGGNEIGMGNLADVVAGADQLPDQPAAVGCDHLVISSTSNWGGYGLVAALSLEVGRNLLPNVDTDADCIRFLVDAGAVSGVSGEHDYLVDEFTLDENAAVLTELHELVDSRLASGSDG
ncbi:D-glutamate cyclase, mitochondrial [Geodia barretti]|uniref:D-glutamate cyclase, mitochondrial n=1 Tax=Geodia barretti TaxID=519541 RepID=A0AA35S6X0_GEOBA|nr:D-glutamate cyclase, mitochondrial [Geodia barretti]